MSSPKYPLLFGNCPRPSESKMNQLLLGMQLHACISFCPLTPLFPGKALAKRLACLFCIQNLTCNCYIFDSTSTVYQHSFCLSNCVTDQLHQLHGLCRSAILLKSFGLTTEADCNSKLQKSNAIFSPVPTNLIIQKRNFQKSEVIEENHAFSASYIQSKTDAVF
jgi:hypothetical protein